MTAPLARVSTVDALVAALRARILDGELPAGARLVERELVEAYDVARHTLRAALRSLAAEGLVELVPNRGARVATPRPEALAELFQLRNALELEAAHLALERDPAALAQAVGEAAAALRAICDAPAPSWSAVVDGHSAVHRAIVEQAAAPRISAAYEALSGELRLFLLALRPVWTLERMAEHHEALARDLPRLGPPALRAHLDDGADAVVRRA